MFVDKVIYRSMESVLGWYIEDFAICFKKIDRL